MGIVEAVDLMLILNSDINCQKFETASSNPKHPEEV